MGGSDYLRGVCGPPEATEGVKREACQGESERGMRCVIAKSVPTPGVILDTGGFLRLGTMLANAQSMPGIILDIVSLAHLLLGVIHETVAQTMPGIIRETVSLAHLLLDPPGVSIPIRLYAGGPAGYPFAHQKHFQTPSPP